MAESKKKDNDRQKMVDQEDVPDSWTKGIPLSPSWWAPTFNTLMIVGLVWLVIYYFSGTLYPIPGIGWGNMAIGIALMMVGFLMTLKWR